jgi:hypothetical protein
VETMRTYVLGVDPGTTTGMAIAMFYNDTRAKPASIWSDELPWDQASDEVANRLRLMKVAQRQHPTLALAAVGEKFVVNAKTAERGQQGTEDALGMLGVLRREARLAGVMLAPQQTKSDVTDLVKNPVLKRLNLYVPGMVHVNDAFRHVVLCAVKRNLLDPKHLLR